MTKKNSQKLMSKIASKKVLEKSRRENIEPRVAALRIAQERVRKAMHKRSV